MIGVYILFRFSETLALSPTRYRNAAANVTMMVFAVVGWLVVAEGTYLREPGLNPIFDPARES